MVSVALFTQGECSGSKRRKSYFSGKDSLYEPAFFSRAPLKSIFGGVALHGFPKDHAANNLDILIIYL